jgi:hypothetical protein
VADSLGLGSRIVGRLGVSVLDERVGAPFDAHTRPRFELVGDLGYEVGGVGLAPTVARSGSEPS